MSTLEIPSIATSELERLKQLKLFWWQQQCTNKATTIWNTDIQHWYRTQNTPAADTWVFRETNFATIDCIAMYICESQKWLDNFMRNVWEFIGRITSEYNNIMPQVVLTRPHFTTTKLSFYRQQYNIQPNSTDNRYSMLQFGGRATSSFSM